MKEEIQKLKQRDIFLPKKHNQIDIKATYASPPTQLQ